MLVLGYRTTSPKNSSTSSYFPANSNRKVALHQPSPQIRPEISRSPIGWIFSQHLFFRSTMWCQLCTEFGQPRQGQTPNGKLTNGFFSLQKKTMVCLERKIGYLTRLRINMNMWIICMQMYINIYCQGFKIFKLQCMCISIVDLLKKKYLLVKPLVLGGVMMIFCCVNKGQQCKLTRVHMWDQNYGPSKTHKKLSNVSINNQTVQGVNLTEGCQLEFALKWLEERTTQYLEMQNRRK